MCDPIKTRRRSRSRRTQKDHEVNASKFCFHCVSVWACGGEGNWDKIVMNGMNFYIFRWE